MEALPQEEEWWNFPNVPLMRANIWWQFKWSAFKVILGFSSFPFYSNALTMIVIINIIFSFLDSNWITGIRWMKRLCWHHEITLTKTTRVIGGIMIWGCYGSWVELWYHIIILPNTEDQGIGWDCFLPNLETVTAVVANPSPKPLPDAVSQAWSWWFLFLTTLTRTMKISIPTAKQQEIQDDREETDGV